MRQTFTMLQNTSKDYISKSAGSFAVSTIDNFIKEHINKRYNLILSELRDYKTQWTPRTSVTVAGQQYYYNSPDLQSIESATVTIGGIAYPLRVINSVQEWNRLNEVDFSGTIYPQYIHPRRDDFGIWPIPGSSGDTITLVGNMIASQLTEADYSTGSVTMVQNSNIVLGATTTFTNKMVGQWLRVSGGDNRWYRIATYATATDLRLETYYEGFSVATATYLIGQTPELPDELHEVIPHGVAADFYSGPQKDFASAQFHNNYFWTGDFNNNSRDITKSTGGVLGAKKRYLNRTNTSVVYRKHPGHSRFDDRWSTTLS